MKWSSVCLFTKNLELAPHSEGGLPFSRAGWTCCSQKCSQKWTCCSQRIGSGGGETSKQQWHFMYFQLLPEKRKENDSKVRTGILKSLFSLSVSAHYEKTWASCNIQHTCILHSCQQHIAWSQLGFGAWRSPKTSSFKDLWLWAGGICGGEPNRRGVGLGNTGQVNCTPNCPHPQILVGVLVRLKYRKIHAEWLDRQILVKHWWKYLSFPQGTTSYLHIQRLLD